MNAALNWWGSNTGPASSSIYGATITNWLVLTITANPTTIVNGGSSTITTDLQHDNQGNYYNPINGYIPNGVSVTYTATKGNINPASTVIVNGQATSIFTATTPGTANITTTVDSTTVSTPIAINSTLPVSIYRNGIFVGSYSTIASAITSAQAR